MRRTVVKIAALLGLGFMAIMASAVGGCAFIDGIVGTPEEEESCDYEGDPAFCDRHDDECGRVSGVDNCGEMQEYVDCSRYANHQCDSPTICMTTEDDDELDHNRCLCPELSTEEASDAICEEADAACGEVEAGDICTEWASFGAVYCGGCAGNRECGVEEANQCACPCKVGGQCYGTGDYDPDDDCRVCDPEMSRDSFVNAEDGVMCEGVVDGAQGSCQAGVCDDEECLDSEQSICVGEQYCADLQRDIDNCGMCGNSCADANFCHASDCHLHRWESYAIITGDHTGMTKMAPTGDSDWDFLGFESTLETPLALAVSPDRGAYVGTDLGNIYHLDKEGGLEWKFEVPNDCEVWSLAVDSSGDVYVGTGYVNDLEGGPEFAVYRVDADGETVHWSYENHGDRVPGIAVDDGEAVYTASFDGTVRRLSLTDGSEDWIFEHDGPGYYDVTVGLESSVYATTREGDTTSGVVQKIDIVDEEPELDWSYDGHDSDVWAVAIGPEGEVYSGGADGTVRAITAEPSWVFDEPTDTVTGVSVDPDGFIYAASSQEGVFKIGYDGELVARRLEDVGSFSGVHDVGVEAGEIAAFPDGWDDEN